MRRIATACVLSLLAALAVPIRASGSLPLPDGARCSEARSLAAAARSVFGEATEVVERNEIAGLETALVLEPRIHPGTRARLLRVEDRWCEATSSFNYAWKAAGRSFEGAAAGAAAAAYAQIAAAPYFDSVRVLSSYGLSGGVHLLETHAATNGIRAAWVITVDDAGIKEAKWEATDFAVPPFQAEDEGLTALPGATESYVRTALGLLRSVRGLPTVESARIGAAPSLAEYVSPDDFVIAVSIGDSRVAIDPDMDTGVRKLDIVRENLRAIQENYEDFYSWGLRKGWGELEPVSGPDKGYLYINDALSVYCFACVFIADDFQIHMSSEVETILGALGYNYPDGVKAYSNIIGHEMFHNFQNRYNKPGPLGRSAGRGTPTAYSEGTARAQEALHDYSEVSFQEESLIYANDGNGCNGYGEVVYDQAMASGLFNKGYTGCYFWLPWIASEGIAGLKRLVSKAYPKVSEESDAYFEGVKALGLASDRSVPEQVAIVAAAAITGKGYKMNGFDWGKMLERWDPRELSPGDSLTGTLQPSGAMAGQLTSAARISAGKDSAITLFVITEKGDRVKTEVLKVSSACIRPGPGETFYVGGVRTEKGSGAATIEIGRC